MSRIPRRYTAREERESWKNADDPNENENEWDTDTNDWEMDDYTIDWLIDWLIDDLIDSNRQMNERTNKQKDKNTYIQFKSQAFLFLHC